MRGSDRPPPPPHLGSCCPQPNIAGAFLMLAASGMLVPFVLSGVVLAPVMEEIVFRGFLYRGWSRAIGGTGAHSGRSWSSTWSSRI